MPTPIERIPQSTAIRVAFQAYLSSDHVSPATGKTIPITISKNGAAYGNPSAGATNATEIANGSYYVDLSTTDTGTAGPLLIYGTAASTDNVNLALRVVDAHNGDFNGVPSAVAGASNGLLINGSNSGTVTLAALTVSGGLTVSGTTSLGTVTISGTTSLAAVTTSGTLTLNALTISNNATVTGTTTFTGSVTMSGGFAINQSSSNTAALVITGNGTGNGMTITSGAGLSGSGLSIVCNATNGDALKLTGKGTGHGLDSVAGATGVGIRVTGGSSSGDGIKITTTSGHGLNIAPVGTNMHGILSTGGNGGTSDGASFVAGTGGVGFRVGSLTSTGAVTLSSTLGVTGITTFTGAVNMTQLALIHPGGDSPLYISSPDADPAVHIVGTVGVTIDGTHIQTGAVTFSSTITANGVITANNASNDIHGIAVQTGGITAASIADNAIDRATFAADTGMRTVRSNTAAAGGNLTMTLDAGASAVNDFYKNDLLIITGGTGAGQGRFITGYTGASKVATVAQWATNPDNTSTFAITAFDNLTTSLTAAAIDAQLSATHGAGAWGTNATGGTFAITITVVDGSAVPIQNATYGVWDGATLVGTGTTNASGNGTLSANAGTYTVAVVKSGYTFASTTRTVTGNQTGTLVNNLVMTAVTPPSPPADPTLCTVYGYLVNSQGVALAGVKLKIVPVSQNAVTSPIVTTGGYVFSFNTVEAVSDGSGYVTANVVRTDQLAQQVTYDITTSDGQINKSLVALTSATVNINTL